MRRFAESAGAIDEALEYQMKLPVDDHAARRKRPSSHGSRRGWVQPVAR